MAAGIKKTTVKALREKSVIGSALTKKISPKDPIVMFQMGKVLVTRDKKKGAVISQKIVELFDRKINADYSTDTIVAGDFTYELKYKLHCTIDISDGATQIENDMLGIFGLGRNLDEAEKAFGEEFHYIYTRYNELPDKKLTKDVIGIKQMLNFIVKKVRSMHGNP